MSPRAGVSKLPPKPGRTRVDRKSLHIQASSTFFSSLVTHTRSFFLWGSSPLSYFFYWANVRKHVHTTKAFICRIGLDPLFVAKSTFIVDRVPFLRWKIIIRMTKGEIIYIYIYIYMWISNVEAFKQSSQIKMLFSSSQFQRFSFTSRSTHSNPQPCYQFLGKQLRNFYRLL